jgi:hypothetical protein
MMFDMSLFPDLRIGIHKGERNGLWKLVGLRMRHVLYLSYSLHDLYGGGNGLDVPPLRLYDHAPKSVGLTGR